jgi:alditol oxidase
MSLIEEPGPGQLERNWAGNYTYAGEVIRPESVESLQELIARTDRIGFLGSRHSFNAIADSELLVDMRALPQQIEVDRDRLSVSVTGGTTYGALAPVLEEHGVALANLASLPHISVAGAISTGTHGSGATVGSLATAVSALEIIRADGDLVRITREDPDFAGSVVSLGALGAIVRVELDVEPAYEVAQSVVQHIPFSELTGGLRTAMASAYSVSLFTLWEGDVTQGWFKARTDRPGSEFLLRAGTPASGHLHPLGLSPENSTPQLGTAGPWFERLPHFRLGFTPSVGDEIQSEYLLDWEHGEAAIEAMLELGPSIREVLQVCEVRTIAADQLWLSPAYGRDTMAIHFTWRLEPPAVQAALAIVEAALLPLGARPHWGKVFLADRHYLAESYPMLARFAELAGRFDPRGAFRNDWLDALIFGAQRS